MCVIRIIKEYKLKRSLSIERIAFIYKKKEYAGALAGRCIKIKLKMQCLSDERLSFAKPLEDFRRNYGSAINQIGFFCFASPKGIRKYEQSFHSALKDTKKWLQINHNMIVEHKIMKYIIPKGTIITIAKEEEYYDTKNLCNIIISPVIINPRVKEISNTKINDLIDNSIKKQLITLKTIELPILN